jgi:hypothetical protein
VTLLGRSRASAGGRLIMNEHRNRAGLHGPAAMRSELDRCFEECFFTWMPPRSGFRYVGERPSR